jgi:protein gp37
MADVFDEEGPVDARARLWGLIEECTNLDWLLLTKRPQNVLSMIPPEWVTEPRFNVWYGTSVEDNDVRERISMLAKIPASIRFLSIEPQIGPIDFPEEMQEIDWAIIGGESHDSPMLARELKPEWVRADLAACNRYGVTPFVKQMGSRYAFDNHLNDDKGGEPDEWPEDIRIREFPPKRRVEEVKDSIL